MEKQAPRLIDRAGYTLVEVLVSAVVMSILIAGMVAVLRKGREIDIVDRHRRQARALVMAQMESETYKYSNYNQLKPANAAVTTVIPYQSLDDENSSLLGTLTVTIQPEAVDAASGVPYLEINMNLNWSEPTGETESISLTKQLAKAT